MVSYVFRCMAKIAHFRDLCAGQRASAEIDKKCVGNPLVPRELDVFISDPRYADVFMWWANQLGGVSHQSDSGGQFRFTLVSQAGVAFECSYDSLSKYFVSVVAIYDGIRFDISKEKISVSRLSELLNMPLFDAFDFIENCKIDGPTRLRLEKCIKNVRDQFDAIK